MYSESNYKTQPLLDAQSNSIENYPPAPAIGFMFPMSNVFTKINNNLLQEKNDRLSMSELEMLNAI